MFLHTYMVTRKTWVYNLLYYKYQYYITVVTIIWAVFIACRLFVLISWVLVIIIVSLIIITTFLFCGVAAGAVVRKFGFFSNPHQLCYVGAFVTEILQKSVLAYVIFVWLRSVSLPMEACVCIIGIKMQKITVIQDKVIITLTMLIEWRWVKTYVDCISALVIASDHAALSFRVEVTFHKVTSPALQKIHLYFFSRQQYNLIIYHL